MNIKLNFFALAFLLIFFSCNNKKTEKTFSEMDNTALSEFENKHKTDMEIESNNKITLIDSKKEIRESDGNFNQMILFEVDEQIKMDQLKDYCSSVKSKYSDGYFQILVFFKTPHTARFPDNPITALHNDENNSKNIKAVYTINNINGYSKLSFYEKSKWESPVQTVDIN